MMLSDSFSIILMLSFIPIYILTMMLGVKLGRDIPIDDSSKDYDLDTLKSSVRKYMADSDEIVMDIIGREHASNILNCRKAKHGFAFVTNKSFYFIGTNFYAGFMGFWQKKQQLKISINNLISIQTGSKKSIRCLPLFIVSIIGIVYVIMSMIPPYDCYFQRLSDDGNWLLIILLLIFGVIWLCTSIYSLVMLATEQRTAITLIFSNSSVRFPVSLYGKEEIKSFYSYISKLQISNLKEDHLAEAKQDTNVNQTNSGKVQSLSELSVLYEKKMISEEEFTKLKKEIIGS